MIRCFAFAVTAIPTTGEASKALDAKIIGTYQLQMECISILERLSEALRHGNEICLRIVLCYKLAARLGKTYESLLMLNDPLKFLQEVVESNIESKFEIANDIILSYKITTENVAIFLTDNITTHISRAVEGEKDYSFIFLCY